VNAELVAMRMVRASLFLVVFSLSR